MMISRKNRVFQELQKAGLTQEAAPPDLRQESPWYVKVLLAFSGWLAALFLLGFVGIGLSFVINNHYLSFVLGGMMTGGAFAMLRLPRNEFFEHLALALSFAGQALLIYAIFGFFGRSQTLPWLLITLLQCFLAAVMPSFVHRLISAWAAAVALNILLELWNLFFLTGGFILLLAGLCWLNEFRSPGRIKTLQAIGYGLVLALIQIEASALFGYRALGLQPAATESILGLAPLLGELLTGATALFLVWQLLRRSGRKIGDPVSLGALAVVILIAAASLEAPGIVAGMVLLLLGFASTNRVLLGLGITMLLFFISSYYYLLETTLLSKSLTLVVVGAILLALRWIMVVAWPQAGEKKHV